MSYQYPTTTYKPVTGPESFDFMIGLSIGEAMDVLFMGTFDKNFHVIMYEKDGNLQPLPPYETSDFNPYRIMVSTRKGINNNGVEDDIIFFINGIF